jgi:hypothetical protein
VDIFTIAITFDISGVASSAGDGIPVGNSVGTSDGNAVVGDWVLIMRVRVGKTCVAVRFGVGVLIDDAGCVFVDGGSSGEVCSFRQRVRNGSQNCPGGQATAVGVTVFLIRVATTRQRPATASHV